jgi:hypothetical protein
VAANLAGHSAKFQHPVGTWQVQKLRFILQDWQRGQTNPQSQSAYPYLDFLKLKLLKPQQGLLTVFVGTLACFRKVRLEACYVVSLFFVLGTFCLFWNLLDQCSAKAESPHPSLRPAGKGARASMLECGGSAEAPGGQHVLRQVNVWSTQRVLGLLAGKFVSMFLINGLLPCSVWPI